MQTTNHRNRLEGGFWGLSVEEDASLKNSVKLREWVGVGDEVEAAVLDNRNFIRVMVGNESYLALLDPGATISLVGSRILNKYRDRLRESSGQVRGVSGVPMKVQGNLRISIDVDGHLGTLEFRAVEEINHEIILGMDFGTCRCDSEPNNGREEITGNGIPLQQTSRIPHQP